MPCYSPIQGFRAAAGGFTANPALSFSGIPMTIPCGQCIGCRLEYARGWAVRCMHEAQLHEDKFFVTLTYDDGNLPLNGSLVPDHLTLFFKRLRKNISPHKIRYYAVGEYGDVTSRPHYHLLLFGYRFADLRVHKETETGCLYSSDQLDSLWGLGSCLLGDLTFESAAYVARYSVKKLTGLAGQAEYQRRGIEPPYAVMSRRPGIGGGWYDSFKSDTFPQDEVISRGHRAKPPRYYLKRLKDSDPDTYNKVTIKRMRSNTHCGLTPDQVDYQLASAAEIAAAKLNLKTLTI